jgi:hypothetical protein
MSAIGTDIPRCTDTMSAIGTKQTSVCAASMYALEVKQVSSTPEDLQGRDRVPFHTRIGPPSLHG